MNNIVNKKKRGRPPNHEKIINVQLGTEHDTYESAAKEIGGYRNKVYLVCKGVQSHHHGYIFCYKREN